jgi:glycosyltransferase involved in cell wall biosynthesis
MAGEQMSNELPHTSEGHERGRVGIAIATAGDDDRLKRCLDSVRAHVRAQTPLLTVAATPAGVNEALARLAPADVVVLSEPCRVTAGWLERLSEAALEDTNTATASALADSETELALYDARAEGPGERGGEDDLAQLADGLAARTLRLRPRLSRAVGPCVYVRRDAIELVGPLDEELDLRAALEVDFAQRCLLSGLAHVAADDVLVARLAVDARTGAGAPAGPDRLAAQLLEHRPELLKRYPYLSACPPLGESSVLEHALRAARGTGPKLWVTLDARALDGAITGTQVHIVELIRALAATGQLRLRLLVREHRIDAQTLELLRSLPDTELLAEASIDERTPPSTVFHRPQQAFAPQDVEIALRLGERIVLSQLDLIAYRNPGYFADADAWAAYRRASRHGMSAAERVVVFSDHTRRELICDALVEDERIRVVAPGLDHPATASARRPAALAQPAGEPGSADGDLSGFLLCLGTDFRHKNRVFALRLLAALRERHGWDGSLVLAGTHIPHGSSRELEQALLQARPSLREAVIELGAISEQEKAWLMDRAAAVVYPSVYEGFGLVPFEAALAGVPCIFAPQSSLAESAPQGAATILPWDPQRSADAAHALLCDPAARQRHVQALATVARGLTWGATADAMVALYVEAATAPVRDAATLSRDAVERERRLTAEHQVVVQRLIGERKHAQRMYDELNAEVGFGLSLIGPHGSLPDGLQRALLAISARPALSRMLYGAVAKIFVAMRGIGRLLHGVSRDTR